MSPKNTISNRFAVIFGIIVLAFIAICVKLVSVRYFENEELQKADNMYNNRKTNVSIPGKRGDIYSADGELLSTTFVYHNVYMDFGAEYITTKRDNLLDSLTTHLPSLITWLSNTFKDKMNKSYRENIVSAYKKQDRRFKLCPARITHEQYLEMLELPLFAVSTTKKGMKNFKNAVFFENESERYYLFGGLAKQTIGNRIKSSHKDRLYGIEKEWNDSLAGKAGKGERVRIGDMQIERCYSGQEARDGYDIHTTIDTRTQNIADKALRKKLAELNATTGCLLLMNSRTGELQAIVNLQRNEDGTYSEQINMAFGDILSNEDIPQPGSTFKVPVMMALLESGKINLNTEVDVETGIINLAGTTVKDDKDHQFPNRKNYFVKPEEVIVTSLNTGISKLLWNAYGKTPDQRKEFYDLLYKMNLNTKTDFRASIYNISEGKRHSIEASTNPVDFVKMSYGYGKVCIPPVNMLMFYNAIANDGKMIKPFFVKSLNRNGKEVYRFGAEVINPEICSPKTLKQIREMLEKVVEHGTAHRTAKSDAVQIAGKTGTAQIHNKAMQITGYQASFAGYFPIDGEMYSCIVVMRGKSERMYGSASAAVVREVAEKMFANNTKWHLNKIPADANAMKIPSKSGSYEELKNATSKLGIDLVGNTDTEWVQTSAENNRIRTTSIAQAFNINSVIDMGLKDAVYFLGNAGYTVRLHKDNYVGAVKEVNLIGKNIVELSLR